MTHAKITERPHYWREHVLAAAAYDGSIGQYAAANNLKTKDLYQWKTSLTKRGLLPLQSEEPMSDFAEVKLVSTSTTKPKRATDTVPAQCRLTLPCGSVLEYFNPVEPENIARLLTRLRT